jgi:hypothetical protein
MLLRCTIRYLHSWSGIIILFHVDILKLLAVSLLLVAHEDSGDCFVLSCLRNFVRLSFLGESALLTYKLFFSLRYIFRLKTMSSHQRPEKFKSIEEALARFV